ncbi:hypothetical protein DdX_17408 [Ditylenchus destructor]|uniref:Uncharacterized protein n=1 Tax=Ditylenchus destructor TaxID=166010 RepID=A0AAD4MLE6_9BILA|nr:hypothetical protein DdX_17408 [Ditylenchus destructor]
MTHSQEENDRQMNKRDRQKQRRWFVCLCVRLILVLAALSFTYLMPHLTPSESVLWIALTVIHIPDCRKLLSWMNWTNAGNLCLQANVYNRHGQHCVRLNRSKHFIGKGA